jgi:hypothetical protein
MGRQRRGIATTDELLAIAEMKSGQELGCSGSSTCASRSGRSSSARPKAASCAMKVGKAGVPMMSAREFVLDPDERILLDKEPFAARPTCAAEGERAPPARGQAGIR